MNPAQEQRRAWLDSLAPGDAVFEVSHGRYAVLRPGVVERRTATQVILRNDRRYRAADGREVGSSHGLRLEPSTAKRVAELHARENRREFAREVRRLEYSDCHLSDGEIAAMLDALKACRKERGE